MNGFVKEKFLNAISGFSHLKNFAYGKVRRNDNILIAGTIILLVVTMSSSAERLPNHGAHKNVTNLTMRSYESVEIFLPENATSGYQWKVINATGLSFLNNTHSQFGDREGVVRTPGFRSFVELMTFSN